MNTTELIELQRLRSERRLLESANEYLHREHAQAQEEIRRLRDELALITVTLRPTLGESAWERA